MTQERTMGRVMGLIMGLLMLGGCSSESSQTEATGRVLLEAPAGALAAQAASGQCVTPHLSATLDIVGVRTGIPMTVNNDCSVSATVPDVPVGTWTFRIIYRSATGGVPMVIAEASGIATVTANTTTSVPLALSKISGPAIAIATGTSHSCALLADGTVSCWGSNFFGQLGNGTFSSSPVSTPVGLRLSAPARAIATSATFLQDSPGSGFEGGDHSCALLTNGTVSCWGVNSWDQLGPNVPPSLCLGLAPCSRTPVDVGLSNVVAIAIGGAHSCALLADKTVSCWGSNVDRQLGRSAGVTPASAPAPVTGLSNVAAVAAGGSHSCALLTDKTVKCWGSNGAAQLGPTGPASPECSHDFVDVPCSANPIDVGLSNVVAIAIGGAHSCALLANKTVSCWGSNDTHQLGRDTASAGVTPASTPASVTRLSNVDTITTGGNHSCALLADKAVKCWGDNSNNQLGNATPTPRFTPVPVIGLSNVAAVAAGGNSFTSHSCALLSDGTVWCWGNNGARQLGDGSITRSTTPVLVTTLSNVDTITAGGGHSCVLLSDKTVQCWGANSFGQLGNGTTTDSAVPLPVTGLSNVTAIAAGVIHSCVLLSDKTVQCWGANSSGQLGNGTTTDSAVPLPVTGLSNVTAIAAGGIHSCALLTDKTVKCWGDNVLNLVDIGLTDVDAIAAGGLNCALLTNGTVSCWQTGNPTVVAGLNNVAAIVAGNDHNCALLVDSTVKCWGSFNDTGELGNGTFTNSSTPVQVFNLANVSDIAAGSHHSCATLSSGTARCWGANFSGQLGNGATDNSSIPEVVTGLSNVTAIAAGGSHSCARLTNGTVSCWGNNQSGQLGNGVILSSLRPVKVVGIP